MADSSRVCSQSKIMTFRSYLERGLPRSRSISRVESAPGSFVAGFGVTSASHVLREAFFEATFVSRVVWRDVTRPEKKFIHSEKTFRVWTKMWEKTLTWHCCMCCNPANGRVDFVELSAYKSQLHVSRLRPKSKKNTFNQLSILSIFLFTLPKLT